MVLSARRGVSACMYFLVYVLSKTTMLFNKERFSKLSHNKLHRKRQERADRPNFTFTISKKKSEHQSVTFQPRQCIKVKYKYSPPRIFVQSYSYWYIIALRWRSRQRKCLSRLRSWVRFSLRTHVKKVCQRSADALLALRFSPIGKVYSVGWDKHT